MNLLLPRPCAAFARAALLLLPLAAALPARAAEVQPQMRILYISSFESDSAETATVVAALKRELASRGYRPEVYLESLDTYRLPQTEESRKRFDDTLDARYAKVRFSIVLAQASDALKAAARYRDRLSYRPPIYCFDWIDPALAEAYSGIEGFYGRTLQMSFPPTLDLAAALFPRTKRAYLLLSPIDPEYVPALLRDLDEIRRARPGLELVPLLNADFGEVERTLAAAGGDALALLLPGGWWLPSGEYLGGRAVVDRLSAAAPLPYFGITTASFGSGLVGGAFVDRDRMGAEAARMTLAIVVGDPSIVPWDGSDCLVPTLDYRALDRFAVRRSLVPPGARILYAPPDFWIRYETQLKIFGVALLGLSLALLAANVVRRRERRFLVRTNEQLELSVARRTEDLTQANTELVAANASLTRTMRELEEAESRIFVSEKLAALGRLTASIGHELNTPLAAISSASRTAAGYLGRGLDVVFGGPLSLDAESCAFFRDALALAQRSGAGIAWAGPEAERQERDRAEAILSAAGVRDAYPIAEELAELGVADLADRAVPILAGRGAETFLAILRGTVGALRAASIAEDAAAKATRVVASLRAYARSGEDEAPEPVLLSAVLQETLGFFDLQALQECGVSIEVGDGFSVLARRGDLVGIFFNLVKNALQAARGSGRIRVFTEAADGVARVSVADTGPGIPDEHQGRIFEPFFSTRPMGEGAGVGLDVSRRLARRNGGDITFRSRPGETVFTVELPLGEDFEAEGRRGL
jgi:signal transduction histidine kinase